MAVTKNIIDMDKVEILEELLEKFFDSNDIQEARNIYQLSIMFLCNFFDHVYVDFDYLKCKLD